MCKLNIKQGKSRSYFPPFSWQNLHLTVNKPQLMPAQCQCKLEMQIITFYWRETLTLKVCKYFDQTTIQAICSLHLKGSENLLYVTENLGIRVLDQNKFKSIQPPRDDSPSFIKRAAPNFLSIQQGQGYIKESSDLKTFQAPNFKTLNQTKAKHKE